MLSLNIISLIFSQEIVNPLNAIAMLSRANQLKKVREDFFLGKENTESTENSTKLPRPKSLNINPESLSNLSDSPSSDSMV